MDMLGRGRVYLLLVCISFVLSCERPFSFSAYEAEVPAAYKGTTEKNLAHIANLNKGDNRPFKIALVSDSHRHYDDLHDVLDHINRQSDIEFIVITGDITETGLLNDYIYFHKTMDHSSKPYVTVIGNHDYLCNGSMIYQDVFGPLNYSFVFNNVKFVLFDNVFWESEKIPEFDWLQQELEDQENYLHVIPFSHIPPFDKQFAHHRDLYHEMLMNNDIRLSIHGHRHDYFYEDLYGDGIEYLTIGSPDKRSYCELSVAPDSLTIKRIYF